MRCMCTVRCESYFLYLPREDKIIYTCVYCNNVTVDQTEKELFTGVWCTQNLLEILNNNLGPTKKNS